MSYKLVKMDKNNRKELSVLIKNMEKDIFYPLGEDFFKIDHGEDYFAFFERLGELHYWCVFDKDKLIAVAAGVIRNFENNKKSWYLCDLKVIKEYRGKGIPQFVFKRAFIYNLMNHRVFRAYAVSMNSEDKKLPFHKIKRATLNLLKVKETLNIYNFNSNDIELVKTFDDFVLTNTKGKKELILKSNKERMNLFHFTKNKTLEVKEEPNKDSIIMLSAFANSFVDEKLKALSRRPDSTATVLTFRMPFLNSIFTDEI